MLTRLKTIYQKYETWQSLLLQNQSVANKIEILKNLSKLEPIVDLYRKYLVVEKQLTQIEVVLNQNQTDDKEMLELVQQEKDLLVCQKKIFGINCVFYCFHKIREIKKT